MRERKHERKGLERETEIRGINTEKTDIVTDELITNS